MKTIAAVAFTVALSGCAMSAAGLSRSDVEMTVQSEKSSQAFATCAAEAMMGSVELRNAGDHYWLLRQNGYGVPVSRWDFKPNHAGGSTAELRASISVNTGDERVRNCA